MAGRDQGFSDVLGWAGVCVSLRDREGLGERERIGRVWCVVGVLWGHGSALGHRALTCVHAKQVTEHACVSCKHR